MLEFDGKLSHGEPIQLVAQFNVPTMEERQTKIEAIRAEMNILSGQGQQDNIEEESVTEDETVTEEEFVIEQESLVEEESTAYEEPEIEIKIEDDDLNL